MSYNANVTTWNEEERRTGSLVVFGVAIAVVLGGIATWWFATGTPQWVYWLLVGLLALVLAFMAVLLFVSPRAAASPAAETAPEAPPAEATMAATAAEPAAVEPRILTLRCGDCGTIFEITDSGERPLYHTCPGCGAEGALRDEPAAAAAPEAAPEPAPQTYAPPNPAAVQLEAPAAEPAAPPVKRLKLRCGGCKEVFAIEDTGERPLKRACPHCGRIGKIG